MTRASAFVVLGVAAVGLILGSSPAYAQNLVVNPSFNTDASSWTLDAGSAFNGANGSPAPGSVLWSGFLPGFLDVTVISQCVPGIVAGTSYDFGGRIRLAVAPAGTDGRIQVTWASDSTCTTLTTLNIAPLVTTIGGSFVSTSTSAVAPAGTVAALLNVHVEQGAAPGDGDVFIDELFLQPGASVPTMNGWWISVLGVALAGIAAMRRLRAA